MEYVRRASISIGAHCFIGMNAMILPGVSVGPGSIVGAGSVVTKDVPADTVVAGNPAKIVTDTHEYLLRKKQSFTLSHRRK
jgi:maltose O-acetyltransferase